MELPRVCILGAGGSLGGPIINAFIDALKAGKVSSVHITTSKDSEVSRRFESQGARIFVTDYSTVGSLTEALNEVDVVVSLIGPGPDTRDSKNVVIEAMKTGGTKIYIPSEFGTNHYDRMKNYSDERYVVKKDHFRQAIEAGIKSIRIFCGLFMEYSFEKWFGLKGEAEAWPFVGTGNEPVALTALNDLGKFTVATALLAMKDINGFPDSLEVCSDIKTVREYASLIENILDREVNLQFTPLEEIRKQYAENPENFNHSNLVKVLIAERAYDYSASGVGNSKLQAEMEDMQLCSAEMYLKQIIPDELK